MELGRDSDTGGQVVLVDNWCIVFVEMNWMTLSLYNCFFLFPR